MNTVEATLSWEWRKSQFSMKLLIILAKWSNLHEVLKQKLSDKIVDANESYLYLKEHCLISEGVNFPISFSSIIRMKKDSKRKLQGLRLLCQVWNNPGLVGLTNLVYSLPLGTLYMYTYMYTCLTKRCEHISDHWALCTWKGIHVHCMCTGPQAVLNKSTLMWFLACAL